MVIKICKLKYFNKIVNLKIIIKLNMLYNLFNNFLYLIHNNNNNEKVKI